MKKLLKTIAGVGAITFALASPSAADNVLLKMPFAFNPKLPNLHAIVQTLGTDLPALDETIKVKIYEPGKLVPPFEILDAVSTGKVNSGFAVSLYWAGQTMAASVFTAVPFGPETGEFLAWYKRGNGAKLHQSLYADAGFNVHPLICGVMSASSGGWYNKEINTIEDFNGLKMRTVALGAVTLAQHGVSASALPVGEIFPALEKGVIDAAEVGSPAPEAIIGLPKVAKYVYFPGWHKPNVFFELLINKDTWDGMTDKQRLAINMACDAAIAGSVAEGEAAQFGFMHKFIAENGVEVRRFSPEILATLEGTWNKVAVGLSQKDPKFAEIYGDLSAFRENYAIWRENAFLER